MDKIDVLVVGAGVVGLAIAKELSDSKNRASSLSASYTNIVVLEKNKSFGQETSSRNSEVIHGGMYYPANSLKAKLCVEGRELLYESCIKNKIPYKKTGKLIVVVEIEEMASLEKLFLQGNLNGVKGLRIITQKELKKLEPNVFGISALYSEETGVLDSHKYMQYLFDVSKDNGVLISYNSEVIEIEKKNTGYKVLVKNNNEILELTSTVIINSGGLESDIIAKMVGIDIDKYNYNLLYCKGQYFRVNNTKSKLVSHLVYPVPKPKSGGLGIHATLDLGGQLRLGPDDLYLQNRIKDYSVDEKKKFEFYKSVSKFMPFIKEDDLFADTAGIRPKLQEEGGEFKDFVINEEVDKGFPGVVNLIGIESPGLTASLAIAKHVKKILKNFQ